MQSLFDSAFSFLGLWMVASVGCMSAGLVAVVGVLWLRKRQRSPVLPEPKANPPKPDPFEYGSATERRSALRRGGNPTKVYISHVASPDELFQGWVVDRSMTGLRLSVTQAIAKKSVLCVRPVAAPRNAPWVQVTVLRCSHLDDRWELGCKFLHTPPWGVLLMFN
jgi:hypothetical protein